MIAFKWSGRGRSFWQCERQKMRQTITGRADMAVAHTGPANRADKDAGIVRCDGGIPDLWGQILNLPALGRR